MLTNGADYPPAHLHDVSEHCWSAPAGPLLVTVAPGAEDAVQLPRSGLGQAHQRRPQVSLNTEVTRQ